MVPFRSAMREGPVRALPVVVSERQAGALQAEASSQTCWRPPRGSVLVDFRNGLSQPEVGLGGRTMALTQPPIWVETTAEVATAPEASAEPALKPNQPHSSSPPPTVAMGRLEGGAGSALPASANPCRGPSTTATTAEPTPAVVWIT